MYMDVFLMIMVFLCNYELKIISSGVSGNIFVWNKGNKGKQGKKTVCSVKRFLFTSYSLIRNKPEVTGCAGRV